ncbi:squamosa promoter-binding-like protein 14 isoform X2 [Impatiens glandulifera]|uniref:squamosa promoter-binding-like protein 14 isoform X2 n=1 Tax=Impatiens glandulifera TaxID=253017 RepID=UPI001FB12F25|nr:squamosa promoter-binding-like protein 14 isoform X2 [Impatiens glandulifera]
MDTYSNSSSSSNSPDSLNGLKFGQKIYFEDVGLALPTKSGGGGGLRSSTMAGGDKAPGMQPKKGKRGNVQNGQPPRCQVEGCKADLTDVKAYYSRHRVCGMHSKSPKVIVSDLEQRFCQQCSRFHLLPEFDQGKRSCRRRLAGHNERRRKPPLGSLLSSRYKRLSSSVFENSSFLMDFSAYQRVSSGRMFENETVSAGDKYFPHLWQSESDDLLEGSSSGNCYSGSVIPSGECLSSSMVSDSSCALSLLSNQTSWCSRNRSQSTNGGLPMVQSSSTVHDTTTIIDPFSDTTAWGFQGCDPPTGLIHDGNGQFQGELDHQLAAQQGGRQQQFMELQQHSLAYDGSSSNHHFNWML